MDFQRKNQGGVDLRAKFKEQVISGSLSYVRAKTLGRAKWICQNVPLYLRNRNNLKF